MISTFLESFIHAWKDKNYLLNSCGKVCHDWLNKAKTNRLATALQGAAVLNVMPCWTFPPETRKDWRQRGKTHKLGVTSPTWSSTSEISVPCGYRHEPISTAGLSCELINTLIELNNKTQRLLRARRLKYYEFKSHTRVQTQQGLTSVPQARCPCIGLAPSFRLRAAAPGCQLAATDPPLRHLGSLQHPFECSRRALKSDNYWRKLPTFPI